MRTARLKPEDIRIWCAEKGCQIQAGYCVKRQALGDVKAIDRSWRKNPIPYDMHCASGRCAQGSEVKRAVTAKDEETLKKMSQPTEAVKNAIDNGKKTCGVCRKQLPNTEAYFRLSAYTGKLVRACLDCEAKYEIGPKKGRGVLKKNTEAGQGPQPAAQVDNQCPGPQPDTSPVVPPGFVLATPAAGKGDAFISIKSKGFLISKALLDTMGRPEKLSIYWNEQTRQLGFVPGPGSSVTYQKGSGVVSAKQIVRTLPVEAKRQIPVEILPGGFVTTLKGEL